MKLIVGIDFGTSTTVVRYKLEGSDAVYSIKDADGVSNIIPTAIFKFADGSNKVYGNEALSLRNSGVPGELITNFKMGLLETDEVVKAEKKAYIEDFLSYIHKLLAAETTRYAGCETDVYISFPAKWSDEFVNFMKDAYRKAGFNGNIIGINEPTAATYNMLFRHIDGLQQSELLTQKTPKNVFMLDMGAGTSDIIIFRLAVDADGKIDIDNMLSYPTVDNPYLCGGREIDRMLQKYVLSVIKDYAVPIDEDLFSIDNAKIWKDQVVSNQLKKGMTLPLPPELLQILKYLPNGKDAINNFSLSPAQFECATAEHWRDLYALISAAMRKYKEKYGIGPEDIDFLYLTGGHSQWYTVTKLFNGEGVNGSIGVKCNTSQGVVESLDFKKLKDENWRMFSDALPHECVATGLCLQDEILAIAKEIETVSSNNVWLQLVMNGVESRIFQIASQGQRLPAYIDDFTGAVGLIKMDNTPGAKPFSGQVKLFTGETLESAKCSNFDINIDFGCIKSIFTDYYIVKTMADISIGQDNTIGITGYVSFDPRSWIFSKEYVRFFNATGKERHNAGQKVYVDIILEKSGPDTEKIAKEIIAVNKLVTIEKAREITTRMYAPIIEGVSMIRGKEIAEKFRKLGAKIIVKIIEFS